MGRLVEQTTVVVCDVQLPILAEFVFYLTACLCGWGGAPNLWFPHYINDLRTTCVQIHAERLEWMMYQQSSVALLAFTQQRRLNVVMHHKDTDQYWKGSRHQGSVSLIKALDSH